MAENDLAAMREEYGDRALSESDLAADPFSQFRTWFDEAVEAGVIEPSAMVLTTVDNSGSPRARTVLLKELDETGFGFHTNRTSQKGRDMTTTPRATVVFPWYQLHRQVIVRGRVEEMPDEISDAYFATRPRSAQISAWASEQSSEIASREDLEARHARFEEEFADRPIPRPPHWGGYRIVPEEVEFWQGREGRLHDRLVYRADLDSGWRVVRLAP